MKSRKELLVQELSKIHLELRHDSRLCSSFIYNQLGEEWDVQRVVQECATMHWLFSFTDYQYRCGEAYSYFSTIFNSGRQVHDFMKINVQPYIKAQTIQFYGGIPKHWPWVPITEGIEVPDNPDNPDNKVPVNRVPANRVPANRVPEVQDSDNEWQVVDEDKKITL